MSFRFSIREYLYAYHRLSGVTHKRKTRKGETRHKLPELRAAGKR